MSAAAFTSSTFASDHAKICLDLLTNVVAARGRSDASASAADLVLRTELAPALDRGDWAALLTRINAVNETAPGAFQLSFYDGRPYLTHVEDGRSSFATRDANGVWSVVPGAHPVEEFIRTRGREPEVLRKRFRTPAGLVLVGFESNVFGSIIPIFSTSAALTFFRNIGGRSSFMCDVRPALPRTAKIVPLVKIEIVDFVEHSDTNLHRLPEEIQRLLRSGFTLTTTFSTAFTAPEFVDHRPTGYSALMIADDYDLGRTGAILRDGAPLIMVERDREYFLEIKGVGLSNALPAGASVTQSRGAEGNVRSGRMPMDYVAAELNGSARTLSHVRVSATHQALYARSPVGVTIPEYEAFSNYEGEWLHDRDQVRRARLAEDLSGQAFRLSTSTRRLAFADNPAFGARLPERAWRAPAARRYYGQMIGDLLIRRADPIAHGSFHAENMVHHPAHGVLTHTDYADMEDGYRLNTFLTDVGEYEVFAPRAPGNFADFVAGLRESLRPRGLWPPRAEEFLSQPRTSEEFRQFIDDEYTYPLALRAALDYRRAQSPRPAPVFGQSSAAEIRHWQSAQREAYLDLPEIEQFDDVWLEDMIARNRTDSTSLRLQFDAIVRQIDRATRIVELGLLGSYLGQRLFKSERNALVEIASRLKPLQREAHAIFEREAAAEWRGSLNHYVHEARRLFRREAELYDGLWSALGIEGRSVKTLNQLAVFKFE